MVVCAGIGFLFGTVLAEPFILAIDVKDRFIGGMFYGGIPFSLAGVWYGRFRIRRRAKAN